MAAFKPLQDCLLILPYVLVLVAMDMLVGLPGHQSRLPKNDSGQRWFKLAQLLQRRRNLYKVNDSHVTIFGQIFYS